MLLGIIYIPPQSSQYSSLDMFDEIENNMLLLNDISSSYCIVGDFNAQTKDKCDILL